MSTLAINPKDAADPHCRYWMPAVQCYPCNGRTVWKNAAEVCVKVKRDPRCVSRHISVNLAVRTRLEQGAVIVGGSHSAVDLQFFVYDFVRKFVLCGTCGCPETKPFGSRKDVSLRCYACGSSTPVDPTEKASKLLLSSDDRGVVKREEEEAEKNGGKKKNKKKQQQQKGGKTASAVAGTAGCDLVAVVDTKNPFMQNLDLVG